MEEVDKIPCLLSLLGHLAFKLIHICETDADPNSPQVLQISPSLPPAMPPPSGDSCFDYQLKCKYVFLVPECTNRITSNEGMQPQQALTDFVSKWCTLFANVYVPCSSLASTSYIDVSNLSEESSVLSDYNSYFTCKTVGYPFSLVM